MIIIAVFLLLQSGIKINTNCNWFLNRLTLTINLLLLNKIIYHDTPVCVVPIEKVKYGSVAKESIIYNINHFKRYITI